MVFAGTVSALGVLMLLGALLEALVERLLGVDDIDVTVQRRTHRREGRS